MVNGGEKGILGEIYSSNFGVVGQGIDDRLDSRSGGCCLFSRRHEEDGLYGLFSFLSSEGMVGGEGRTMIQGTGWLMGRVWEDEDGIWAFQWPRGFRRRFTFCTVMETVIQI